MGGLIHVTAAEVIGNHRLRLTFEDGTVGDVDFSDRDWLGVFAPLRDPAYFGSVSVDAQAGTVSGRTRRTHGARDAVRGRQAASHRPLTRNPGYPEDDRPAVPRLFVAVAGCRVSLPAAPSTSWRPHRTRAALRPVVLRAGAATPTR